MLWQNIITGVIVFTAAAWLSRRVYRTLSSAGHSGGCGTCDRNPQTVGNSPMIQLGTAPTTDEKN